jgi:hypothetical protein
MTTFLLPLILGLAGQATQPEPETKGAAAERLKFMRSSLEVFKVQRVDDPSVTYRLEKEPVIRFTNPVGTSKDGAVFLWRGEGDRPEAAVQVFWHKNGNWFQEFSSFSPQPLSAGTVWTPGRAGVTFKPVPGAPRPAETTEQRLRQMRALAADFSAEDEAERRSWQKLRLLTKPFTRYGKSGGEIIDGALFSYVISTDPEVYLMLEARRGKDGPEWQYAFAPASIYALRGFWKKTEVWSLPYREAWTDSRAPFYVHYFHRGLAKAHQTPSN